MVLPFVILFQTAASCPTLSVLSLIEPRVCAGASSYRGYLGCLLLLPPDPGRPPGLELCVRISEGRKRDRCHLTFQPRPSAALACLWTAKSKDRARVHFAACVCSELFQRQRGRTSRMESFPCLRGNTPLASTQNNKGKVPRPWNDVPVKIVSDSDATSSAFRALNIQCGFLAKSLVHIRGPGEMRTDSLTCFNMKEQPIKY